MCDHREDHFLVALSHVTKSKERLKTMRSIGEIVRMTDSPVNLGREGMLGRITDVLPNHLRNQPILQQYVIDFLEGPGGRKEIVAELQIEDVRPER